MKIIEPKTELVNISDPLIKIELCGRTCYKSEDKITPDSAEKFVKNIIARGHESVLEHAWFIVQMQDPEYSYYQKILSTLFDHGKNTLLKSTSVFERNIVSGNARMWRDFMRNMAMIITPPNFLRLFEDFPELFSDVMPDYPARTLYNPIAAKLISESDLINVDEIKTHASQTVRFTVDRGISHELVRHREASFSQESTRYCNYSKDKFGNEITVIKPCFWDENSELYAIWKNSMFECEESYFRLLGKGASPQEARSVLPTELKTEVVMTTNLAGWDNFFKQRTSPAAHPQMREVAIPLVQQIKEKETALKANANKKAKERVKFL